MTRKPFDMAAARQWTAAHRADGPINKSRRAAQRLPAEALPLMIEIMVEEGDDCSAAFSALYWNGAKVESDATDDTDPTWYRVTLPDGTVVERKAGGTG
jgi:hypothetical protein